MTSCVPTERMGSSRWTSFRSSGDLRLRLDGDGDLVRGHRAEELALLAGPRLHGDGTGRDQLRRQRLELALARRLPALVRRAQGVRLLDGPLVRLDRQPARDQVVARVAVGDLDDVAGVAELVDGLLQDDLHRVEYGSRAISRALFTAVATSR